MKPETLAYIRNRLRMTMGNAYYAHTRLILNQILLKEGYEEELYPEEFKSKNR